MKKIISFIAAVILGISSVASAEPVNTSGSVTIGSHYIDKGTVQYNGKAFTEFDGSAQYKALTASVAFRSDMAGAGFKDIEAAVDAVLTDNLSAGVKTYSLANVNATQDVDVHANAKYGIARAYVENQLHGSKSGSSYIEGSVIVPAFGAKVNAGLGAANKAFVNSASGNLRVCNEFVGVTVPVTDKIDLGGMAVYNHVVNSTFDGSAINYVASASVKF